jgi:membrane protease YdiL (CAAX protease family)
MRFPKGLTALALGAILVACAVTVAVAFATVPLLAVGWLRAVPGPAGSSIGLGLAILWFLAPAALWGEMVFRGYGFSVLAAWWGTPAALGITSLAFGLVHLQNQGATVGSVAVVVVAGLFLGAVLVVLRSLWAAFAAHLAWNWALAGLVSGPRELKMVRMPISRRVGPTKRMAGW